MKSKNLQEFSFMKYLLALLLFGSNGIVASRISLSSYEIVFFRTFIGCLLLLIIFLFKGGRFTFFHQKRAMRFLIISGMAMGTSWIFLYEAYQQIGVSMASLAYYCGPVLVMILSPIFFKENLTITKIMGFITVFIGIILVNGRCIAIGNLNFGIFCGFMSAVMYAFMVICNKKAASITGLENSLLQLAVSFFTVTIFISIRQDYSFAVSCSDILPILILGFINTGMGCYLYFSSIGQLRVQTVAICGYLEPLSAVLFSAILLQEALSELQLMGAIFIIGGAVLASLSKNPPTPIA